MKGLGGISGLVLALTLLAAIPAQGRQGGFGSGGGKPVGPGPRGAGHGGSGRHTVSPSTVGPPPPSFKLPHRFRAPGFAPWLVGEAWAAPTWAARIEGSASGRAPDSGEGVGSSAALAAPAVHPKVVDIVPIDIKPGSFPNRIAWGSEEPVPVAIVSTRLFDAGTVALATVTVAGPAAGLKGRLTERTARQDVNGDGLMDLVVYATLEALLASDTDADVVVEGTTSGGTSFWGRDTVRVIR